MRSNGRPAIFSRKRSSALQYFRMPITAPLSLNGVLSMGNGISPILQSGFTSLNDLKKSITTRGHRQQTSTPASLNERKTVIDSVTKLNPVRSIVSSNCCFRLIRASSFFLLCSSSILGLRQSEAKQPSISRLLKNTWFLPVPCGGNQVTPDFKFLARASDICFKDLTTGIKRIFFLVISWYTESANVFQ